MRLLTCLVVFAFLGPSASAQDPVTLASLDKRIAALEAAQAARDKKLDAFLATVTPPPQVFGTAYAAQAAGGCGGAATVATAGGCGSAADAQAAAGGCGSSAPQRRGLFGRLRR